MTKIQHTLTLQSNNLQEEQTRLQYTEFSHFLSGNMTANEMKTYQHHINQRFIFIIEYYNKIFGHDHSYFCYTNANEYNNLGFFDIDKDQTEVDVESQFNKQSKYPTLDSIPTTWFYSDITLKINERIQHIFKETEHQENEKNQQIQKIADTQTLLDKLHNSIKNKLTPEEISSISFLSAKDYLLTVKKTNNQRKDLAAKINRKAKEKQLNLSHEYKLFRQNNLNNISFEDWVIDIFKL